ncbi:hypothetical protein BDW74DRAFT_92848 [Aspergillus multicolor]|uniref:uncharacterized protein n=1 Tax=Aspergillus multicolor TaxID=41759 RepID=UPI003CCD0EC7
MYRGRRAGIEPKRWLREAIRRATRGLFEGTSRAIVHGLMDNGGYTQGGELGIWTPMSKWRATRLCSVLRLSHPAQSSHLLYDRFMAINGGPNAS